MLSLNPEGELAAVAEKMTRARPASPLHMHQLAGLAAHSEDSLRRAATLLAHSLDPCVAFKIGIEHA